MNSVLSLAALAGLVLIVGHLIVNLDKITELLRMLSSVYWSVKMTVCNHGCDILDLRVCLRTGGSR